MQGYKIFPDTSSGAEYLAVSRVARATGMSPAFWWKQVRSGQIPYVKFGRAVRVRWGDVVERYLATPRTAGNWHERPRELAGVPE